MSQERKKIIIKEINYWKEHNLLPIAYCDFLLALYTHGESNSETNLSSRINNKSKRIYAILNILATTLLALSLLVTYFTQFSVFLQISILIFLLLITFGVYKKQKAVDPKDVNYILIILLILMLIVSVHFVKTLYSNGWLVNIMILLNIIAWFVIGLKKHYKFLYIISVFAFIFLIILNVLS